MSASDRRDPQQVEAGLAAWLRETRPALGTDPVADVTRAAAGLTNETLIVTLAGARERIVVRLPPVLPTFPDAQLAAQAALHERLVAAGVPAPAPALYVGDGSWVGTDLLVTPFVDGHVPGQMPALDSWINAGDQTEQRRVQDGFVDLLAHLHGLDPDALGAAELVRGAGTDLTDEVAWWQRYAEWAAGETLEGRLRDLLAWCARSCPATSPPASVLWGDPRLENVIFDEDRRIVAALDWETASIGAPELDLGWYLGLDRIQAHFLGSTRVPGFGDHDAVVARYESALGRPVEDLRWHEIFAVARSIAISRRQAAVASATGARYPVPGDDRNPMFDVVESWISEAPASATGAAGS